jgi:hypothetical protein
MSLDFFPNKKIAARKLFDGRLARFHVREYVKPGKTSKTYRCLSDCSNWVWVTIEDDGYVSCLTAYGLTDPVHILVAVSKTFDTYLASEFELAKS